MVADPSQPPSATVVGNSFVKQYYTLLNQKPESLHRFYKDESSLTRCADDQTVSETVCGQKHIEEKIHSLEFCNCRADIDTIECQKSMDNGVMVMVTGNLCNGPQQPRRFCQSFFLAPQPGGYYVLNDIFRYLGPAPASGYAATGAEYTNNVPSEAPEVTELVGAPAAPVDSTPPAVVEAPEPEPAEPLQAESMPPPQPTPAETQTSPPLDEASVGSAPAEPAVPKSWAAIAARPAARPPPTAAVTMPPGSETVAPAEGEPALEMGTVEPVAPNNASSGAQPVDQSSFQVFVSGIKDVSEAVLRDKMAQYGPVVPDRAVSIHSKQGNTTDFAFVTFASPEGPQALFAAHPNGELRIDGYACVMKIEEKRAKSEPRGGRGGRGKGDGAKGSGRGYAGAKGDSRVPLRRTGDGAEPNAAGKGGRGRGETNSARPDSGRGGAKAERKGGKAPRKPDQVGSN